MFIPEDVFEDVFEEGERRGRMAESWERQSERTSSG